MDWNGAGGIWGVAVERELVIADLSRFALASRGGWVLKHPAAARSMRRVAIGRQAYTYRTSTPISEGFGRAKGPINPLFNLAPLPEHISNYVSCAPA